MATHSSTLAWKIPWAEEEPGVHGVAKSRTRLSDFTSLHFTLGEQFFSSFFGHTMPPAELP